MIRRRTAAAPSSPSTASLLLAYATVYVVWGSTYLAIRFAIDTLPPLTMTGARFVAAGGLLFLTLRALGHPFPTRTEWTGGMLTGALMLAAGVGGVSWAEQRIPSGVAALLVALVPIWMVLLEWMRTREQPSIAAFAGLLLGLGGVCLLVSPQDVMSGAPTDLLGTAVVLAGSFSWAFGSVYGSAIPRPDSPFMAAATQMLTAGGLLGAVGWMLGERVGWASVTLQSAAAWGYLVVFGSLVAFTAYTWLLRVDRASRVGTYAYVNPVVAVLLGWALAGEPLSARVIGASVTVVGAVLLVRRARYGRPSAEPAAPPCPSEQADSGDPVAADPSAAPHRASTRRVAAQQPTE